MPIYRGTTPLKAYKGDMQPVNVYRGSTKVAGWHLASYSGTSPLTVDCDYNVPPDALVIDGKCVQTGTPSPDSPAPISTITGDVWIAGKGSRNLFDKSAATSGYMLTREGSLLSDANSNVSASIPVVGGGTYTWSGTAGYDSGGATMYVCEYDISNTLVDWWSTNASRTLTLHANTAYLRISIPNGNVSTMQLENGSSATAYQAFAGYSLVTAALGENACASLPDGTHDSYDAVTGVLTKRVGKIILNGIGYGIGVNNISAGITQYYIDSCIGSVALSLSYSDYFVGISTWDVVAGRLRITATDIIPTIANSIIGVVDGDTDATKINAFKAWLAANPVTVYYKLATPTTVQLTPHLPVVRTGIKTLSIGADVVPTLSATVKSMESAITSITQG